MRTSASPPGPGDEAQRGSVGLNGTYWASRSQRHRTAATLTFRASWDTGPGPSSITAGGSAASISSEGSPCNEPNPVRAGGGQQAVPGRAPIPTPPLPPPAAHHQPVPPPGSAAPWPCRAPRCPGSWRGAAGQRRCAAAGGEVGRPRWRSDVLMKVSGPRAVHKGEPEPGPCRAGGGLRSPQTRSRVPSALIGAPPSTVRSTPRCHRLRRAPFLCPFRVLSARLHEGTSERPQRRRAPGGRQLWRRG